MILVEKANPFSLFQGKAGVPNFDPVFSSGYPEAWFTGSPFAAMRQRPGINHPWVYAAITTIIESYVQCPLRMFSKRDPKKELIDDHPILRLLKHPNPMMSGTNFLESIMWDLCLPTKNGTGGTAFLWSGDGCNFRKGQIPDELWIQNDAGVKPKVNHQKILEGWIFDYQSDSSPYDYGRNYLLDLQEVIRINFFNPYGFMSGVSPGHPLRSGIAQDASAISHNSSLLENGMTMRGAFSSKKPLNAQQLNEFRANMEKTNVGSQNAGKNLFIPYEIDFNQLSLTNEDMQYYEMLGWNREAVIAAYKVSEFALQISKDMNYATAKEAKRQLFEQSILPKSNLIMMELNQSWLDYVGNGDMQLCIDTSQIAALHDDVDARYKRSGMLVDMGVPPILALKMNQIPIDELDPKKMPWLMTNLSPQAAFTPASGADDDDASPGGKALKSLLKKKDLTREEKYRISDDYIAKVLDPGEKLLQRAVTKFWGQQRDRVLEKIKDVTNTSTASDFMPDRNKENTLLRAMIKPHYDKQASIALHRAKRDIANVKKDVTNSFTQADVQAFIAKRLKFISTVNETTFDGLEDAIAESLSDSISNELSVADTAKNLKQDVAEEYASRGKDALTVARTETGTVSSYVQHGAMKAAGIKKKQWGSARDEFVRDSHVDCDAEGPIDFDDEFDNGLDYPLDPSGDASETINCRCVLMPVRSDDDEN